MRIAMVTDVTLARSGAPFLLSTVRLRWIRVFDGTEILKDKHGVWVPSIIPFPGREVSHYSSGAGHGLAVTLTACDVEKLEGFSPHQNCPGSDICIWESVWQQKI